MKPMLVGLLLLILFGGCATRYLASDSVTEIGCVVVAYDHDVNGRISNYEVVKSQPPGRFDRYALGAMAGMKLVAAGNPGRGMRLFKFVPDGDTPANTRAAALCQ